MKPSIPTQAALLACLSFAPAGRGQASAPFTPRDPGSEGERGGALPEDAHIERLLSAMGTSLRVEVWCASRPSALAASEAAVRAIGGVEARLSTWTEDSELSALNRTPVGIAFVLSPELDGDLRHARSIWRETGRAFDPGVGALVRAFGLRGGGRDPDRDELRRARAGGGIASLRLDGRTAVRTRPGMLLEEGGFGKGVGLDAALSALARAGALRGLVDLGGQVAAFGHGFREEPLVVALADPRDRARPVLELDLCGGSLATSGNSERGILVGGKRRSHILDPRSGSPAPDFGSVTVWAPSATDADALSTALFVLGPDAGLRWAARAEREVEVIVLEAKSTGEGDILVARLTPGWRGRVRALVPGLTLQFQQPPPFSKAIPSQVTR